ncbi:STAS domain-containing protein [Saccharothrix sp. S26]|uniref:STAS domain-containing protein n=1 Tax=Saccharothrix sp. S26 TaxID=2907215 RepID=UPI001F397B6A|nr:STAS domain-containing protein [Saccharothrix sp. S26]MCE7000943.1 STAS domain-containing protein [Saccharothrix sp. S26]
MGDTTSDTITRVHHHDDITVVEVIGEIDMACEKPVRAVLTSLLDDRPAGLVVDLTRVDFFGSSGIQLLVEAVASAERRGVALAVATDRRAVLRPLEITLIIETVEIHPTLGDALAALRSDAPSRSHRMAY